MVYIIMINSTPHIVIRSIWSTSFMGLTKMTGASGRLSGSASLCKPLIFLWCRKPPKMWHTKPLSNRPSKRSFN